MATEEYADMMYVPDTQLESDIENENQQKCPHGCDNTVSYHHARCDVLSCLV